MTEHMDYTNRFFSPDDREVAETQRLTAAFSSNEDRRDEISARRFESFSMTQSARMEEPKRQRPGR
ncbi:MAG: hypothetical protein LBT92_02285 [Rickettsiales bacterium]|jgi:hypothetical protein|nr:hypothetical protein [Rickettsiales bacterium]